MTFQEFKDKHEQLDPPWIVGDTYAYCPMYMDINTGHKASFNELSSESLEYCYKISKEWESKITYDDDFVYVKEEFGTITLKRNK